MLAATLRKISACAKENAYAGMHNAHDILARTAIIKQGRLLAAGQGRPGQGTDLTGAMHVEEISGVYGLLRS